MSLENNFIKDSVGKYNINGEEKWWTNIFYENAYEIVKDRKYPITIPSYNRADNVLTIKNMFHNMRPDCYYPVFVFVRDSQKQDYEQSLQNYYGIKVVSFPDNEIDNIGATRRRIVRWLYDRGFDAAFMLDDDLLEIAYTYDGLTGTGYPKAQYTRMKDKEVPRIFAMWQLSMEKAIKEYNVMCNGISPIFSSWKFEYTDPNQSLMVYRGLPNQCFCLNVKGLIENEIEYLDTNFCGHEDIDLAIRITDKNLKVSIFPFLVYAATPMRPNFGGFGDTMEQRMRAQQEIMIGNHSDKEWVRFADKRGLAQVSINWIRVRKVFGIDEYKFNIWEHGKIINK